MDNLRLKSMDKLTLKWKIFAFLLGFCALLLMILWLFQTVLLTDMYKLVRKSEMEKAITLVEKNIDNPELQTILKTLEHENEIFVMPEREFVSPSTNGISEENPEGNFQGDSFVNPNGNKGIYGERGKPRPETLTETRTFVTKHGQDTSMTFHAMITPVGATVSTLRFQLYFITLIMLLLAISVAIIIAQKVSRPIEDINRSAKGLSEGKYDTRFEGHGFLEIKELADTLNSAAIELSKVENLRRELLANISHDLRTPLSLIYSYAEMMQDFPGEITPQHTQTIMDETTRLSSLVSDVLDISRLESGDTQLHRKTFDLTQSIENTTIRMSELVKNEGYSLHFACDSHFELNADEVKITQAFYNLLINAINYSGEDKRITVRQIEKFGFVRIEVEDCGQGIDPESLPYIWDRYYKGDKNHQRPITGTGLGLSIVKKIIDLHDGKCGVESPCHSGGSLFWFELPLSKI